MKLLIIRPQPGADATAARVRSAGHDAIVMPLFEVQPVAWDEALSEEYGALLLTSGNAVRLAGEGLHRLRRLPVYAVGSATARAAEQAALEAIAVGDAGVSDILVLARQAGIRHLLWLAGEDRIDICVPEGMTVDVRIVYRSAALPNPSNFANEVGEADAALLHSPRAARHFAELCDAKPIARAGLTVAALSPAIAESAGQGWKAVITAPAPNDVSLLSRLQSYFTNLGCDP